MEGKKTICLFEDDLDLRDMYATKLREAGYEVCEAEDGLVGLEILKTLKPDLIILDLIMPNMDGYDVLARLNGDKKLKDVPVFVLTNLSQQADMEESYRLQAQKFFIKIHYTPNQIVEKIEEYFNHS